MIIKVIVHVKVQTYFLFYNQHAMGFVVI